MNKKKFLESLIDTKEQRVVSIERIARALGIKAPTKAEQENLVDSKKFKRKESK